MEFLYRKLNEHDWSSRGDGIQECAQPPPTLNPDISMAQVSASAVDTSAHLMDLETFEVPDQGSVNMEVESEAPDVSASVAGFDENAAGSVDASSKSIAPGTKHLVDHILDDPGSLEQEFIGPSCGLSLLSNQGLRWVQRKLGSSANLGSFRDLLQSLTSQLKVPTNFRAVMGAGLLLEPRKPLPSPDVARKYVNGYFDFVQSLIPLVSRTDFEVALEKTLRGEPNKDTAWYALYNAIFAIGCRIALSADSPASFKESEEEAWGYFVNALSVQTELFHMRDGLTSVQALAAMAIFGQGVCYPQQEYMFCSFAVRAALAKGLQTNFCGEPSLSREEIGERSAVFWSLYALEKTTSFRLGRPSAIDDEEVSCPFPHNILSPQPENGGSLMHTFLHITRLARIASKIRRGLYSSTALTLPPEKLIPMRDSLEEELLAFPRSLPDVSNPLKPLRAFTAGPRVHLNEALFVRFAYFDAVGALHRRFATPYLFDNEYDEIQNNSKETELRRAHSIQENVESARQIVLLTRHIEVESYTPSWILVWSPLVALTTLFAHVISEPLNDTAADDIALMEVVNGLFGHLQFLSSGHRALDHAKNFVLLALQAVQNARIGASQSALAAGSTQDRATQSLRSVVNFSRSDSSSGGLAIHGPDSQAHAMYDVINRLDLPEVSSELGTYFLNLDGNLGEDDLLETTHMDANSSVFFSWVTAWTDDGGLEHQTGPPQLGPI